VKITTIRRNDVAIELTLPLASSGGAYRCGAALVIWGIHKFWDMAKEATSFLLNLHQKRSRKNKYFAASMALYCFSDN